MTQPDDVDAAVRAVVEQGVRLGLQWRTIPATVKGTPDDVNNVALTLDGDSVVSRAQSLIGQVFTGQRVMILIVPPSTNYIIGTPPTGGGTARAVQAKEPAVVTTVLTSYTAASPTCGVAFVAPPSGQVVLHYGCSMDNNTTTGVAAMAPQVRVGGTVGSGTIFYTAVDDDAVRDLNTNDQGQGRSVLIPGLTPGTSYNAELLQKSTGAANTATFAFRNIIVVPA